MSIENKKSDFFIYYQQKKSWSWKKDQFSYAVDIHIFQISFLC